MAFFRTSSLLMSQRSILNSSSILSARLHTKPFIFASSVSSFGASLLPVRANKPTTTTPSIRLFHASQTSRDLFSSNNKDRVWTSGSSAVRPSYQKPKQEQQQNEQEDSNWKSGSNGGYQHFGKNNDGGWQHKLRQPKYFVLAVVLPVGGGVYYVTHLEEVPVSGRRRMIDMSTKDEIAMGEAAFAQIKIREASRILPDNHKAVKIVRRVGARLAKVVGETNYNWEMIVVDRPIANAFCMPGGKICVYTGLLNITKSEDELAAVMAHELAHALARHSAEKLTFTKVLFVAQIALSFVIETTWLTNYAMQLGLTLPFSRKMETEADYIGLLLMSRACYDPRAMASMFKNLGHATKEKGSSDFLSTHPSSANRVEEIEKWLPKAEEEREESCSHFRTFNKWSEGMGIRVLKK